MPRISEFYGIVIEMYFDDHPPPHFHARYSGEAATIAITTGEVIGGTIPVARSAWCENGLSSIVTSSWPTSSS